LKRPGILARTRLEKRRIGVRLLSIEKPPHGGHILDMLLGLLYRGKAV
jgi:hypothetical protein